MNETDIRTVVNGRPVARTAPTRQVLAEFLRDTLGLRGTKLSCGMQVCGVCTVLVDGQPVSACTYLAADVDGRQVETIEGLADGDRLHPVQQAFVDAFGLQCGYCTPGFVMTVKALLAENPDPTRDEVADYLDGNICRCTGYFSIIEAALAAARATTHDRAATPGEPRR